MEIKNTRFICDVIDDIRMADKTKNYSYLEGLLHEANVYTRKMEDGLDLNKRLVEKIFNLCIDFEQDQSDTEQKVKNALELTAKIKRIIQKRYTFPIDENGKVSRFTL